MNGNPLTDVWPDLPILLAVSEGGSFLAAGRLTGLSTSTVSRRISRLEERLDTALVSRTSGGAPLTEIGQRLVEKVLSLDHQLAAALRDLPSLTGELRGSVRVTMGDGFLVTAASVLERFAHAHPNVRIELNANNRLGDLAHREFDLALRTVYVQEDSLVYRKLGELTFGLHASKAYVERYGMPGSVAELRDHRVIGFSDSLRDSEQVVWLASLGITSSVLRVNTFTAMLEGTRAGIGIAPIPHMTAQGLQPVLPRLKPPPITVYLATHPAALQQPHVRAFADALIEQVRRGLKHG